VGPGAFLGLPIDVSAYSRGQLSAWRGSLVGSGVSFGVRFDESTDRSTWFALTSSEDPGADTEGLYEFDLSMRWLRAVVNLSGSNPGVTCWVQGFLESRER
jgi:hypothetical protein